MQKGNNRVTENVTQPQLIHVPYTHRKIYTAPANARGAGAGACNTKHKITLRSFLWRPVLQHVRMMLEREDKAALTRENHDVISGVTRPLSQSTPTWLSKHHRRCVVSTCNKYAQRIDKHTGCIDTTKTASYQCIMHVTTV